MDVDYCLQDREYKESYQDNDEYVQEPEIERPEIYVEKVTLEEDPDMDYLTNYY